MTQLKERSTSVIDRPVVPLVSTYTSTGEKLFHHTHAMESLRNGTGRPITTHAMPTSRCQDSCSFCSVATRKNNSLKMWEIESYLDTLCEFGLKSCILSGGGNPLLWVCPETKKGIADLIDMIHAKNLQIGMITNGMKLRDYGGRMSYATLPPKQLDKLTWIRVSCSGWDHPRGVVEVPDIDPSVTTLGGSYVLHDSYIASGDPHGKTSTMADVIRLGADVSQKPIRGKDRLPELTERIQEFVETYRPSYYRTLPNCLERSEIASRCKDLQVLADAVDPNVVFVQYKPPNPHTSCHLGYVHPVLSETGRVFPCDSCTLNDEANHSFDERWSICHWSEIRSLYEAPVRSLIKNPLVMCDGCVFGNTNRILSGVVDGTIDITPHGPVPEHVNFV